MNLGKMRGITAAFSSGLLTATGAEALYDTTAAITYCINGKMYVKATVANGTAITTDVNGDAFTAMAANKACVFVWGLNAAGTVQVAQGEIESLETNGSYKVVPSFPTIPDTMCPFAYQMIKNGSTGSAWTFGTGNWNATGITDLITNVSTLPDRPQKDTTA